MKKKVTKKVDESLSITGIAMAPANDFVVKPKIAEITEGFGNGELNVLKDKINEIIRKI